MLDGVGVLGHATARFHDEPAHGKVGALIGANQNLAGGACTGGDGLGGQVVSVFQGHVY